MHDMNKIKFVRKNIIANKVVLIDGAPRSAKSLLGQIIGSFERVEIERMDPLFESLAMFYSFKKISKDAATSLLRREIDIKLYESMISRNTNFKVSDRTSIFKSLNPMKYIIRIFEKEGQNVLKRVEKEKPIFQIMTHDTLQKSELFFDVFEDKLKIIEMVRHPIDLVSSMKTHGYGSGIGKNPLLWEFAINDNVPYYAFGWIQEYLECSEIDRIIKIVFNLTKEVEKKYSEMEDSRRNQVLFIPFEAFVTEPNKYLTQLTNFLGTRVTKKTKKAMIRQRIPRVINIEERSKKYENIKNEASPIYMSILDNLIKNYEKENFKKS